MTPTDVRAQLIRDEGGVRARLYYVNGIPHIAAGHNLSARPISDRAARVIAEDDFIDTAADVQRLLPWTDALDPARRAVFIGVAYWAGTDGLLNFRRMIAAAKQGDWKTAARELLDATPPASGGTSLIDTDHARAERLALQMEDGQWR